MTTALDYVRYSCGIAGEEVASMVDSLESDVAVRDQYVEELRQRERELLDKVNVAREALKALDGNSCGDYADEIIVDALKKLEEK